MRTTEGRGYGREDFARETGTAADVEDEGGGGETEEGEGAVGHFDLDGLDAGGGGVFTGFGIVVEEVGRTGGEAMVSCGTFLGNGRWGGEGRGWGGTGYLLAETWL